MSNSDVPITQPDALDASVVPVLRPLPPPRPARRPPLAFYRDVVGSMRNGVVVITSRGVLAHINREACRILGLAAGPEDVGRRYVDVLRDCPEIIRILRTAFESSSPADRAELRLRSSGRVIGYTVCPVRDGAGRLTGATLLFKDLTRVEQLEERERLRDRLAALGEMAATIAHEVKNPLTGIKVMAGLLKRHLGGVEGAEDLLNDIINEAKMADAIVLEILDFVRPIRLQMEPVSLPRLVEEALRVAETRARRGDIAVRVEIDPDLPAIEADPTQIRQLFTNLLTNAFEALDHRGTISVAARSRPSEEEAQGDAAPPAGSVVLSVADNGPGIPEDYRDRVFSPFFSTKARGSGLGLAIVRKIVDAHDGRIDLKVGAHGGTRFEVTLPIAVADGSAHPFAEPFAQTGT
jgi:two-component system nitrogen regulation sensor histidine kinase GlnL